MSVQFPAPGEVFTVRIYKNLEARPDLKWANSYEFRIAAGGTGVMATVENVAQALFSWEVGFHLNRVEFDRMVVSTYVPDGQPYNPASFMSIDLSNVKGARQADLLVSDVAPLQVCLMARAAVDFGRNGRRFYRGVLVEADFTSAAGDPVLTVSGAADIAAKMLQGGENVSGLVANEGGELVMKGSSAQDVVREVRGITPAGVVVKQLNNRYYDRG